MEEENISHCSWLYKIAIALWEVCNLERSRPRSKCISTVTNFLIAHAKNMARNNNKKCKVRNFNIVAEEVYREREEHLVQKMDLHLILLIMLMYLFRFLDRSKSPS
jgi:hypothetical protein